MTDAPVALVTGASRGIGKASAIALAAAGFDVAITAGPSTKASAQRAELGPRRRSDRLTAREPRVDRRRDRGTRAARVDRADGPARRDERRSRARDRAGASGDASTCCSTTRSTRAAAPRTAFSTCGWTTSTTSMRGNFAHQLRLIQLVVPHMLERGHGRIMNMVSGSARHDPPGPAGAGGWGIGYAASKAAFGRVAGGIEAEFKDRGVRAFNVDPGNVITEKRRLQHPERRLRAAASDRRPRRRPAQWSPGSPATTKRCTSRANGSTPRSSAPTAASCPAGRPRA